MTHRESITAHKIPSRNVVNPSIKKTRQKLLIQSKKYQSQQHPTKVGSYFLRVFISGAIICGLVALIFFIKRSFTNAVDLSDSYTMLIREVTTREDRTLVLSLRGNDKSINYSVLPEGQDVLVKYFPIDSVVEASVQTPLYEKSSFAALFVPWKRDTKTELSFFSRLKIWQYLLTIDSAHFQKQEVSEDSDKLLLTIQKYFADTELRQLAPTIAVVNTTEQNGLAKRQADILNAWGFTVIQVDSKTQEQFERTRLISDPELVHTRSANRLKLAFPDLDLSSDEQQLRFYRTQFVLFIGNDYK